MTPERVQSDFWFISDREDPQATLALRRALEVRPRQHQLVQAAGPVGARSDQPRTAAAPAAPPPAAPAAPGPACPGLPATGLPAAAPAGALLAVAAGLAALRGRGARGADLPAERPPAG